MRILVHEFVSGGGLAGRSVKPSLAREGAAMLTALLEDLASLGGHQIVTTADARFPLRPPAGVEVATMGARSHARVLDHLLGSADAAWLIAPETGGCLEHLVARAERAGTIVLGSASSPIRHAADKARLPRRLARHGVRHPMTELLHDHDDARLAAERLGFPVIVKPERGAGCDGVFVARHEGELGAAVTFSRRASRAKSVLLQQYVRGVPASVSLVADGARAIPLTVNRQLIRGRSALSYRGGRTPLEHPMARRAAAAALGACRAIAGLRGYVGVDLIVTKTDAVVIEINPRLTTSYLGARIAIDDNIAALAIAACFGSLPARPAIRRSVRFDTAGRVVVTTSPPRRKG
jgi:tyramine---L-glutamate ligase